MSSLVKRRTIYLASDMALEWNDAMAADEEYSKRHQLTIPIPIQLLDAALPGMQYRTYINDLSIINTFNTIDNTNSDFDIEVWAGLEYPGIAPFRCYSTTVSLPNGKYSIVEVLDHINTHYLPDGSDPYAPAPYTRPEYVFSYTPPAASTLPAYTANTAIRLGTYHQSEVTPDSWPLPFKNTLWGVHNGLCIRAHMFTRQGRSNNKNVYVPGQDVFRPDHMAIRFIFGGTSQITPGRQLSPRSHLLLGFPNPGSYALSGTPAELTSEANPDAQYVRGLPLQPRPLPLGDYLTQTIDATNTPFADSIYPHSPLPPTVSANDDLYVHVSYVTDNVTIDETDNEVTQTRAAFRVDLRRRQGDRVQYQDRDGDNAALTTDISTVSHVKISLEDGYGYQFDPGYVWRFSLTVELRRDDGYLLLRGLDDILGSYVDRMKQDVQDTYLDADQLHNLAPDVIG